MYEFQNEIVINIISHAYNRMNAVKFIMMANS